MGGASLIAQPSRELLEYSSSVAGGNLTKLAFLIDEVSMPFLNRVHNFATSQMLVYGCRRKGPVALYYSVAD